MKNEKWNGQFSYRLDDNSQSLQVKFELNIEVTNESFRGVCIDEEFTKICDISPIVKGFTEEDFISFVIIYPYAYFRNNVGELVLDTNVKNFQVEHEGTIISDDQCEGEWSATFESVKISSGNYQESYITGNWNLQRAE